MGDSSSTDYNGNGFDQGGDGAVFGDPGSDPGSVSDYDTWDWKQIEAAINGMSAGVDNSDNSSHAASVSDPGSLQTAANAFYTVQMTLSGIAQSLSDQANALAGPNGPWTGDAADSFIDMINTFSKQVAATANVLSGGATGTHSVPQQLADNAVNLQNAQNKISEIDTWYANQAIQMGVTPMSNGLIPISQKPQLVQMMTSDMRAVLKSLAGEYQVTIDAVRSPQPITSPGDTPPPTDAPPLADTDAGLTDQAPLAPDLAGLPTDQTGQLDADPADTAAAFPGDLSSDGTGGLPTGAALDPAAMDAALNPSAFPGGTDTGTGADPSAFADDPAAFPGGTGTGIGDAVDPAAFPGGTGTGIGDGVDPAGFPGGTGVGATGLPLGDEELASDPLAADATSPESFPGGLGTGAGGALGADDGLPADDGLGTGSGKAAAFPGGLSTESGMPDGLGTGVPGEDGVGTGTGEGASSDGMPYMPGMGGGTGGLTGDPAGERSDASGLLGGDAEPWAGSPDVGEGVGSPLGTAAGGTGLDLPGADGLGADLPGGAETGQGDAAAGDGMPYMPGMGGGAGQSGDPAGERSDASGLLSGDAEPWAGSPDVGEGEGVGSPFGTAAGGTGLDLPGADGLGTDLPGEENADGAAGDGMPYMPGMGGGAGQSGDPAGERSDASGLLEGEGEPWAGSPDVAEGEGVGSPLGAAAGGTGLDLPVADGLAAAAPATMAADGEQSADPDGEGMPYLPGMGGPGSQSAEQHGERSDASGLLDGETDPWAAEPDVGDEVGSALGAAAGAAALGLLAASAGQGAARTHDDAEPLTAFPVTAEAATWAELPEEIDVLADPELLEQQEPESAAVEAEQQEEFPEEYYQEAEPLTGGASALIGQAGDGAEESAAWDAAGESLVPLLWGLVNREEEHDVLSSGYSGEDASTWTGRPESAAASGPDADPDDPGWTTWQPNRTPSAGGTTERAMAAAGSMSASCSTDAFDEVEEEPLEEPAEEPAPSRSIADLLVQDGDTWGSVGPEDTHVLG